MSTGKGANSKTRKKLYSQADSDMGGKLQPQAIELEEAVLGALLLDSEVLDTISKDLSEDLFYKEQNQIISNAILSLYKKNDRVDILTVSQELKRLGQLELVGGSFYVSSLTNRIASSANIEYHVKILQQQSLKRSAIRFCTNTIKKAYDDSEDVFDLYAELQMDADNSIKDVMHYEVSSISKIHQKNMEESREIAENGSKSGVECGLDLVDDITSGWQKTDLIILAGRPSMGKFLKNSSLVYTPKGHIQIGDAKVGEKILGSDGKPYSIIGVFPQGKKDVYRIYFDDNTFVDSGLIHQWEVSTRADRRVSYKSDKKKVSVLNTEDMIGSVLCSDGRNNYSIRLCSPLNFKKSKTIIDPYLLGVYLGDGYTTANYVGFSNTEIDVVNKIQNLLPIEDRLKDLKNNKDYIVFSKTKQKRSLLSSLIGKIGLHRKKSHEKFIPKNYLYNSIDVRVSLLQGLVDTDGFVTTKGRNAIEYSTVSAQLRDDILELVRGLGGKATYQEKQGAYTKKGERFETKKYYRMYLSLPKEIVPVSSKKHLAKYKNTKQYHSKFITKIEKMDYQEEMTCISVDAPDCLYITDGYTLTHNTACAISMIIHPSIEKDVPVAIFSLEMSNAQLGGRIESYLSGVDVGKIIKKQLDLGDVSYIENACKKLNTAPLYIDDTPNISLTELKSKARRLHREKGIKLIVIDYLQLMRSGLNIQNREQEIAEISKGLKALAKELDIPIIALSQLSRGVEGRTDKKPQLSDLRESGQIEQDADMVMFCYRPEYYGGEVYELEGQEIDAKGLFILVIAKNRNGSLCDVPLRFIGHLAKITNHPEYRSPNRRHIEPVSEVSLQSNGALAQNTNFLSQSNEQYKREEDDKEDNSVDLPF